MQSKLLLLLLLLNALPIFDKHLAAAVRRLSCFHRHPSDSPPVLRIVGKIMIWVNKKASPIEIYDQQQPINPKPIVATKRASERASERTSSHNAVAGVAHATPATATNDSL
jgi:hypothetical protein